MVDRELDVLVHGATGFVGRLLAARLAAHAPAGTRVGLSGRSPRRLAEVKRSLGEQAAGWPVVVADSADEAALAAAALRTRVVASTVGPYSRHGLPLVAACADAGTDYVDLTGEVLFMRRSIDGYDALARSTGARIVHACGFDSIPSDIGVHVLHQHAAWNGFGTLGPTTFLLTGASGGVSGGTVDTVREQVRRMTGNTEARRIVADPYSLSPDRSADPAGAAAADDRDRFAPRWDPRLGAWLAPFVMASANTRVVRRSNALLDHAYGPGFRYREAVGVPGRLTGAPVAAGIAAATVALGGAMALPQTRALLDRVLPKVGSGPDEAVRGRGYFTARVHTTTSTGRRLVASVEGQGDPGCAATSVMLAESALALALDRAQLPRRSGVLTPATALGPALVDRLRAAGMTLTVADVTTA